MAPLTEQQLELISHETQRAVSKALRKHTRGTAAAFLFLFLTSLFVYNIGKHDSDKSRTTIVQSGRVVAVDGCNRDFRSTQVLRGLITSAQAIQESEHAKGNITDEQYALGKRFYDDQLAKIILPDCLMAQQVLTDDPDTAIRVPKPLRP